MKINILNLNKIETKKIDLPSQFYEPIRMDLIKKAFLVIRSNNRQPYGADPRAGMRASADVSRRRRKYRGSYGFGISRVPRKILSRRGTRMSWVGAVMPGTVGGRRAHPPKADKIWSQKINITERRKAIRSAIAATINKELVKERGHKAPENYPFIIEDKITEIKQTKKLIETLDKLGFKEELSRSRNKNSKGLLLVTSGIELQKVCANIPGFETESVSSLNVELLAPGGIPGRLTIFTESAIKLLEQKKLFTKNFKGEIEEKIEKKETKQRKIKVETKPKKKITTKKISDSKTKLKTTKKTSDKK